MPELQGSFALEITQTFCVHLNLLADLPGSLPCGGQSCVAADELPGAPPQYCFVSCHVLEQLHPVTSLDVTCRAPRDL